MKLDEITRTEVFFTGHLYQVSLTNREAMQGLLRDKLHLQNDVTIIDSGFEVCFFRDFAKKDLIEPQGKSLGKQTFDNVFILSDNSLVLFEAKAHQKFSPKQIEKMKDAAQLIENSRVCQYKKVFLIGLHSSKYSPKRSTVSGFDAVITWREVAEHLGDTDNIFSNADKIYND